MSAMSELDIKVQESKGKKIHYIDTRLFVNGGLRFPSCKAGAKLLDLDAGRLPLTSDIHSCSCKICLKIYFKGGRS